MHKKKENMPEGPLCVILVVNLFLKSC